MHRAMATPSVSCRDRQPCRGRRFLAALSALSGAFLLPASFVGIAPQQRRGGEAGKPSVVNIRRAALLFGVQRQRGPCARRAAAEESADNIEQIVGDSTGGTTIANTVKVKAIGKAPGSFALEMGGMKFLVNPNLDGVTNLPPNKVHELFDYVVVTSGKKEFAHLDTLSQMNMLKTKFVVAEAVKTKIEPFFPQSVEVLSAGADGQVLLEGTGDSVDVALMVVPGANVLPWQTPEIGFIFINMQTGVAVGYEALGEYLGPKGDSSASGIPEAAYQIDHLITPSLRVSSGVVRGLAEKGTSLQTVVRLPVTQMAEDTDFLSSLDNALEKALGNVGEVSEDFVGFLRTLGPAFTQTRLVEPLVDEEALELG